MNENIDALFEESFFTDVSGKRTAAGAGAITPAGEMSGVATGVTSLRFTTAKAKIPGLKITETKAGYILSGPQGGLLRCAAFIKAYIGADNGRVPLTFSEDLLNYEPDDELIHKSSVPLWVIKPQTNGSISVERTWNPKA